MNCHWIRTFAKNRAADTAIITVLLGRAKNPLESAWNWTDWETPGRQSQLEMRLESNYKICESGKMVIEWLCHVRCCPGCWWCSLTRQTKSTLVPDFPSSQDWKIDLASPLKNVPSFTTRLPGYQQFYETLLTYQPTLKIGCLLIQ